MTAVRVIEFKPADLCWDFEDNGAGLYTKPRYKWCWRKRIKVDPTPGYPHERMLVRSFAEKVYFDFPLPHPPTFYISPFEEPSRTNGWTDRGFQYDKGRVKRWEPYIFLSGKRIPPMPAMTRYLVAHEYGHVVAFHLSQEWGDPQDTRTFLEEYRKLRGLPKRPHYGPGNWHADIGEVFANDFRILVCKTEPEYWPHMSICRPELEPQVVEWWAERIPKG